MPTITKHKPRPWLAEHKPHEGRKHPNTKFYQSAAWRKLRAVKLSCQPMCEECERNGVITPAQMVDHIIPINKGGTSLDIENLQSLCNTCHNRKSAKDK